MGLLAFSCRVIQVSFPFLHYLLKAGIFSPPFLTPTPPPMGLAHLHRRKKKRAESQMNERGSGLNLCLLEIH